MSEPAPIETTPIETVQAWVQDAGYRAQLSSDGKFIRSATGGLKFALIIREDTAQLYLTMDLGDSGFNINDCNKFNLQYRFSKLYIDGDGDLMLEHDFILMGTDETRKQLVKQQLELWDGTVSILVNFMREARKEKETKQEDLIG